MEIKFFTGPAGGVIEQLRNLTGIPEENKVILLDIPSDGAFYVNTSGASVKDFIADVWQARLSGNSFRSEASETRSEMCTVYLSTQVSAIIIEPGLGSRTRCS